MKIQENVLLKDFTTFRIGGFAKYFCVVKSEDDLREAFSFAKSRKAQIFVLGGGSNILVSDHGFSGLVIKNEIKGIKFTNQLNDEIRLEVGAGEILDEIITLSVMRNLFGLENLSGIPGTVGGAVVQNAGAYGLEIKDRFFSVRGLNSTNGKSFVFRRDDCQFGYRNSLFKKNKKFIITSVILEFDKKNSPNISYANLKDLLGGEKEITPLVVREIILKIRKEKLPDWHKIGTAGSFFKNPILSKSDFEKFKGKFADVPSFSDPKGGVKVPLAWIMDNICKLKGFKEGKVGLYKNQPLVVVNLGNALASDVVSFSNNIKNIIKEKTGIEPEEEVEKVQ